MKYELDRVAEARFWIKVEIHDNTSCWEWVAGKTTCGYGSFCLLSKPVLAHRVSYQYFNYDLSDELVIDHKCRNRSCVNPDHLRQVTKGMNTLENSTSASALNALKTHCVNGHSFTGENVRIIKTKNRVIRRCTVCERVRNKKQKRGIA